ncbi:presenilins-associated rhomboid-like protein, mitochondrial isoform X2 [Melanotaenia boesemani]|uniref:presenilins-associated rhomboid-like protein, mitochondrial isoform X2 n=1 Tax=Melanotaenia boesemani TaxID=1250792 RepID=UPI001C047B58|nr:presenilins-associated rhomboid-like protein, mitochondrial isoform X2 [Melanotaenia boesemani]
MKEALWVKWCRDVITSHTWRVYCKEVCAVVLQPPGVAVAPAWCCLPRHDDSWPVDLPGSPVSNMAWRSCSVLFRLTGKDTLRGPVRGGRCPHSFQQRCGFKKAARKPETKKVEEDLGPAHSESSEPAVQRRTSTPTLNQPAPPTPTSPRAFGRLFRPLLFTVGFTGCSFGSAAIWQYESLKSRVQSYFDEIRADWLEKVRPQKRGDVRKEINQWWNSLSEGQKTVTGIIAVNAVVFCCWRVPSLQRVMIKYFTSNPASKTLCSPMLLSTFSHYSFFHMAANMYVLWSFSTSAVSMLGREQFMAVYLSAGVVASFVSYVGKMATGRFGPSLGASGAIMTVLAAVCTKMPEAKLAIIFLPMFTFTAASALKAIVAMDTAGLVLGWKFFDHAAHLGGALFGIWYILFGHELIWKNREPFVKFWHDLRTRGGGGGGGGGAAV